MNRYLILLIGIAILNCCKSIESHDQKICIKIKSEIENTPYMALDSIWKETDTLFCIITDSISFRQPHIESEQFLFFLRKINEEEMKNIKVLSIKFLYPNRKQNPFYHKVFDAKAVFHKMKNRYFDNKTFNEIAEMLFYDRNSRDLESTLILFNYGYGYLLDTIKQEIPYNENVFELFYYYSLEVENYKFGKYNDLLCDLLEFIDNIPNANYPTMKLKGIVENTKG